MNILAPSILSADFCELGKQIEEIEKAGAQYLHVDVMDGIFVPSISFGMPIVSSVRPRTKMFMDVHMMVTRPERYVEEFIRCGADGVTIHEEACDCVAETLCRIREAGAQAGLAINPETPVEKLYPYLDNGYGTDHDCTSGIWRAEIYRCMHREDTNPQTGNHRQRTGPEIAD